MSDSKQQGAVELPPLKPAGAALECVRELRYAAALGLRAVHELMNRSKTRYIITEVQPWEPLIVSAIARADALLAQGDADTKGGK